MCVLATICGTSKFSIEPRKWLPISGTHCGTHFPIKFITPSSEWASHPPPSPTTPLCCPLACSSAVPFNLQQTLSHFRPNGLSIIQIIIWISLAMEISFAIVRTRQVNLQLLLLLLSLLLLFTSLYCDLLCARHNKSWQNKATRGRSRPGCQR